MNKKQEIYDRIGAELVNHLPSYRDMLIEKHIQEAEKSGIQLKNKHHKKLRRAPTIDMFPGMPSRRKEDNEIQR